MRLQNLSVPSLIGAAADLMAMADLLPSRNRERGSVLILERNVAFKRPQHQFPRLHATKPLKPIPVHRGVDWQIAKKAMQADERRKRKRWAQ